jgi:RNA polymerase sigma-70 factor (ECF subfamily)
VDSLAERLAQGEPGAWEELYKTYKNGVVGLCLGYLHNREAALDAAEEAFVKAFTHSGRVKASGNVRAWLYTIAANTCKDMLRKQKRGQAFLKKWMAGKRHQFFTNSIEETLEKEQREDTVRVAISKLEETYRIPLILRFYEDMDYDEIAETLSEMEGEPVKRGTVASRLNRAKQKLKVLLEEN